MAKVNNPLPVSIIVLTWNGIDVTKRCLTSLLEKTTHPDFEVIVVDNGSTDGTCEYLRGIAGIKLIENGENLGFVRGNNLGIRATNRDVLLLNNDTEIIQSDWLERIQEVAYSSADIGIVGCRLVNDEGELVHAGTYMPLPSYWGQEYPAGEKDIGQYIRSREVDGVIAACVYIKRELIDRIGLLDESYFSYYEDTDYCLKAKKAGFRVFMCGSATVKHLENASTSLNRMDFSSTFKRSREIFISKWKDYYESIFKRNLTWRSFISGDDFFSFTSRALLKALEQEGVNLNLAFIEGAEKAELDDFRINDMKNRPPDRNRPQVCFSSCDMFETADGSYNIGYTFTPYDRFPLEWVREMRRMDEIWVTSEFQKAAALESGYKGDVFVIEPGIDPDYFHPQIRGFPLQDRFTLLAIVEWNSRFAFSSLLRAFTSEFSPSDGVVLVIMASSSSSRGQIEHEVEAMNLPLERAPVVFVVDQKVPFYQLGSLLKSADCLVSVEREAENSFIPKASLACGVPVVCPRFGSVSYLIDERSAFGVDCKVVNSDTHGLMVADPDFESLAFSMRKVYQGIDEAKGHALAVSERIRQDLCWEKVAKKIIKRLDVINK